MQDNPYQAPTAPVADPGAGTEPEFYVVAARKFLVLMIATLGGYSLYWFWHNWRQQNRVRKRDYWPIPRAIFQIFFAHALFAEIRRRLDGAGSTLAFAPQPMAILFVVSSLGSTISDRLAGRNIGSPWTDVLGLLLLIPVTWTLYRAQLAANAACGDADGAGNAHFSAANLFWILLGLAVWLLVLAGMLMIFGVIDPGAG